MVSQWSFYFALVFLNLVRISSADEKTFSIRSSVWSDSRSFDGQSPEGSFSAWMKMKSDLSESSRILVDGWIRNDQGFRKSSLNGEIREAKWMFSKGLVDLELGRNRIVWGRADGFNPTDVWQTKDLRLLTPTDDEQKSGAMSALAKFHFPSSSGSVDHSLTVVAMPEFRGNLVALPSVPGIQFQFVQPVDRFRQFGTRFESVGGSVDGAISYYNGIDRNPDLIFNTAGPSGILVDLGYRRIEMLGVDASAVMGQTSFRLETAMTWTEDPKGEDFQKKNPFFSFVVGADRNFGDQWNLNLQWIHRRILNYQNPESIIDSNQRTLAVNQALVSNQYDPVQNGISSRILFKAFHDTFEAEFGGLVWVKNLDFVVRPRIRYQWSDRLQSTLGADVFRGPSKTNLGFLKDLSTAFFEFNFQI